MAGTSSGPGWRGGAARKNQFPNRDRLGVTTLKSAAAHGPSLVSGSGPPKTGRPLPSAADDSAGCFSRHRRDQFRDRLGAHDLSGFYWRDRMLPEVRMTAWALGATTRAISARCRLIACVLHLGRTRAAHRA